MAQTKKPTPLDQLVLQAPIGFRVRKDTRIATRCGVMEVKAHVIIKDKGIIARLEAANVKLDPAYED